MNWSNDFLLITIYQYDSMFRSTDIPRNHLLSTKTSSFFRNQFSQEREN